MNKEKIFVSIIIRTFNEEKYIGRLLKNISSQDVDFNYEIIIVDSGSTDLTLEIVNDFDIKLIKIDPEDFTFGYSLNQGVKEAKGDLCYIISAHCFPIDQNWLQSMSSLFKDEKVALVYGKQIGDEKTRYSEHQIFAKWFPSITITDSKIAFCNNANSAIRRSVWESYQFNESLTGLEDLDWARYVMDRGYKVAYQPEACVYHIHEETWAQIYQRYYREGLAYKDIYKNEMFSFLDFVKFFIFNWGGDYIHAFKDRVFLKNMFGIPLFRFCQFFGYYRAHKYKVPISKPMQYRVFYPRRPKILPSTFHKIESLRKKRRKYKIIDISRSLHGKMALWPNSTPIELKKTKTLEIDGVNDTDLTMNLHAGTHLDAPSHFIANKKNITEIDLYKVTGEVIVLEYKNKKSIDAKFFIKKKMNGRCKKILIKTLNSNANNNKFNKEFIALGEDAAMWLVNNEYDLVGIDGPSIEPYQNNGNETHRKLLENDVTVLENLDLSMVEEGHYKLVALPLKIENAEASPVRAILMKGKLQ